MWLLFVLRSLPLCAIFNHHNSDTIIKEREESLTVCILSLQVAGLLSDKMDQLNSNRWAISEQVKIFDVLRHKENLINK